jgi:hypothetical protein
MVMPDQEDQVMAEHCIFCFAVAVSGRFSSPLGISIYQLSM